MNNLLVVEDLRVTIAYVAGIGRVAGAVIAGLLMSANGLFVNFLNEHLSIGQYQTIVAGIALALTAIKNPDGVASELASSTRGRGAGWAPSATGWCRCAPEASQRGTGRRGQRARGYSRAPDAPQASEARRT